MNNGFDELVDAYRALRTRLLVLGFDAELDPGDDTRFSRILGGQIKKNGSDLLWNGH